MGLPVVVLFAVDVAVPGEARDLPVQGVPALTALEAGGVPPPVHRLEIEPVGDPEAAAGADGAAAVFGAARRRRRRRSGRVERLQLGYVVFEGGVRSAELALRLGLVEGRRAACVRSAGLVVVVGRGAARTAAGYRGIGVPH